MWLRHATLDLHPFMSSILMRFCYILLYTWLVRISRTYLAVYNSTRGGVSPESRARLLARCWVLG